MNQQTQTPAARYLADLRSRGVEVALQRDTEKSCGVSTTEYRVQLRGGIQYPGEFDKVKRFKAGLVELLSADNKFESYVGELFNAPKPIVRALVDPRKLGPRYQEKEGDEKVSPSLAPAPVFKPLDESKTRPVPKSTNLTRPKSVPVPRARKEKAKPKEKTIAIKDETGNSYGRLTVSGASKDRGGNGQMMWLCKCECGGEVVARGNDLRTGRVTSCRHCNGENRRIYNAKVGDVFGEWKVVDTCSVRDKQRRRQVYCECSCGVVRPVAVERLARPKLPSRSCGHTRIEKLKSHLRKTL